MRAEFRIWHEGDRSFYAMTPPGRSKPEPIADFPIGSEAMVDVMQPLIGTIEQVPELRHRLYGAEFLTTRSGEVLLTLIYHRKLDEAWEREASTLAGDLNLSVIGRSRGQKVVINRDYVVETFKVNNRTLHYQQVETGFTQPNAGVNEKMLNWATTVSGERDDDLLELYCGNGNFTIALADGFRKVLATEVSKLSVASALYNKSLNNIDNLEVVRMSSEDFTDALNGVRPFRRLREIDLNDYNFSTLLVDPPRAGLDDETLKLASRFQRIIYISCNPATLKNNLEQLTRSHSITRFAVFDQFPYTHHLECGVLLESSAH
jgi:tRNA (uracil-5-)-methyltransferase